MITINYNNENKEFEDIESSIIFLIKENKKNDEILEIVYGSTLNKILNIRKKLQIEKELIEKKRKESKLVRAKKEMNEFIETIKDQKEFSTGKGNIDEFDEWLKESEIERS